MLKNRISSLIVVKPGCKVLKKYCKTECLLPNLLTQSFRCIMLHSLDAYFIARLFVVLFMHMMPIYAMYYPLQPLKKAMVT